MIAAALWFGVGELSLEAVAAFRISWLAVGALAVAGILLGFLAGSRLSPVASLLGGLAFTGLGVVPVVEIMGLWVAPDDLLPRALQTGYLTVGRTGVQLFLGVALLVVSLFPSRWRSRAEPVEYSPAYSAPVSPYLPQGGPEDATRPMYRD
ncbi:hypothetical protein [Nonomuraea sp. H19]|uniref:hypothetical protein n=1 Tax=Nonomuraea sp. H19 TaxID=3452206 RepID=UPI003F8B48DF